MGSGFTVIHGVIPTGEGLAGPDCHAMVYVHLCWASLCLLATHGLVVVVVTVVFPAGITTFVIGVVVCCFHCRT